MKLLKIDDIYINVEYIEGFRVQEGAIDGSVIHIFPVGSGTEYKCHVKEKPFEAEQKMVYILTYSFRHQSSVVWEKEEYRV